MPIKPDFNQETLNKFVNPASLEKERRGIFAAADKAVDEAKRSAESHLGSRMLRSEYEDTTRAFGGTPVVSGSSKEISSKQSRKTIISNTPKVEMPSTFSPKEWAILIVVGSTICLPACLVALNLISR